jgi:hypothetical protein
MAEEKKKRTAWAASKKIDKGLHCSKCGKQTQEIIKHHPDYNEPSIVIMLCKECHFKYHHGVESSKKDNSTLYFKASLRNKLIKNIKDPLVVIDVFAGAGKIYDLCYKNSLTGVAFERNPEKVEKLVEQREKWLVYECDSILGINAACGSIFKFNFIDVDPYGDPWPALHAIFSQKKYAFCDTIGIAVMDGLRQGAKMQVAWKQKGLKQFSDKYGNAELYKFYKELCKEKIEEIISPLGFRISKWAAYYCGTMDLMTHYGGIFKRRPI